MTSIKVMPLLLAVITPLIMTAGVARADTPIVLAQANTQQQGEKHQQQHNQQPQHRQQPQPHGGMQPSQQHGQQFPQHQQQQHVQQPQQHTPQGQQHTQQLPQNQQHTQHQTLDKGQQDHKALEQHNAQQQKLHDEQRKVQDLKAKGSAEAQKNAQDAAKLHNDQHKIQQQQQQLRHTEQQLHQEHQQLNAMHHELSAADQKAKAARDAHQADRARLIEKQKQMAAHEKTQAAINERLRLQNERLKAISSQRHEVVDAHGQKVITEPGNLKILQANGHTFIQHDEMANFRAYGSHPLTRRGPNGNAISVFTKPDGSRIEIEVDSYGRPLRRVRYLPDGRRYVLFENAAIAAGVGIAVGALIVNLPPPEIEIPRDQYIVDADVASEDDIYGALEAGPVVPLDQGYSLDQVLASAGLRERMRSVNIDSINFDFGSWQIGTDQAMMLEPVAAVMRNMVNDNPGEVFLIEGHTDAVGSDVDNLSLSDRRAQAIADVLAEQFGIPRENMVTQGYGKQFLLIPTPEPERRNRRVVIRRITPLLQTQDASYSASDGGPGDDQGPR